MVDESKVPGDGREKVGSMAQTCWTLERKAFPRKLFLGLLPNSCRFNARNIHMEIKNSCLLPVPLSSTL